jgi:hypothetical protein
MVYCCGEILRSSGNTSNKDVIHTATQIIKVESGPSYTTVTHAMRDNVYDSQVWVSCDIGVTKSKLRICKKCDRPLP